LSVSAIRMGHPFDGTLIITQTRHSQRNNRLRKAWIRKVQPDEICNAVYHDRGVVWTKRRAAIPHLLRFYRPRIFGIT